MSLRLTLSLTWDIWPLVISEWFYTDWVYCDRCADGHYMRRSLRLDIALPFSELHVSTPAWFRTYFAKEGHGRRAEEPPQ